MSARACSKSRLVPTRYVPGVSQFRCSSDDPLPQGFFSLLKRGVIGTFHHINEAHLARNLAEFDFRYSNGIELGITDTMRTDELLRQISGKRLADRRVDQAEFA